VSKEMHGGRRRFIFVVALFFGAWVLTSLPTFAAPFQPGDVFFTYGGNRIAHIYGSTLESLTMPESYSFAATTTVNLQGGGIALDEEGNLYVTFGTGTAGIRGIIKFHKNGEKAKILTVGTSPDFRGIAAKYGKVAVATPNGVRIYDSDLNTLLQTLSGNYRYVAFDNQGNLYALHQTRVDRYRWDGSSYILDGTIISGLSDAITISVDTNGNLYIVERGGADANKVLKFTRTTSGFNRSTISRPPEITGGNLFGLAYEPGIDTFFVINSSSTMTDLLKFRTNDGTMSIVFKGRTDITNARWLAVYPTPEPTIAILLAAGWLFFRRRSRR